MQYHHPLENPSLAPYGFVFAARKERLAYRSEPPFSGVNEEHLVARLWDKKNQSKARRPLPVETIVHKLLPGFGTRWRMTSHDFMHNGLPYLTRDILVLGSTIAWLGTNVGRSFLEADISTRPLDTLMHGIKRPSDVERSMRYHKAREFVIKLETHLFPKTDPAAFFLHECSDACKNSRVFGLRVCHYHESDITPRDRMLIHALMYWLGSNAGRDFLAVFEACKKSAWHRVNTERRMRTAEIAQRLQAA